TPQSVGTESTRELNSAMEDVSSYQLLTSCLNVFRDLLDKTYIIAILEFTPFFQLTPSEKDDLNFISTFLHQTKPFISPGRWRNSYTEKQICGCYIKKIDLSQLFDFNSHYKKPSILGHIIGTLFKNLSRLPFQDNQDIMKKYNITSLADLSYGQIPEDSTSSPHIFTNNVLFNPPHKYKDDISQYAFVLWLATCSSFGSLFGIEFNQKHGILKMIWQANKYTHCTTLL
ncbi:hypothetical protein VP01_4555g2, partial [Puccinia sorghi]